MRPADGKNAGKTASIASDVEDLYEYFGIDADTIVGAAVDLIEERGGRN